MSDNPVISALGRKLRLGVIGGGPGSFIGAMHRAAARLDDRYELVAGVLSSNPDRSKTFGADIGISADRAYGSAGEMLSSEAGREGGIDVCAIMTPNDSHFEYCSLALDAGFDVICDKPMTNTLDEAIALHKKVVKSDRIFCLTHNYTGYPMVRQARAMVADGQLGDIRMIQVEYVQGGNAADDAVQANEDGSLSWRLDPERGGPSLVLGDIGTHAHNLACFISGLELTQIAAQVGTVVPDRKVHDVAGALLRFDNGAVGNLWATQAAAGVENCLRIRISGSLGTIEWWQETPAQMAFRPLDGPAQMRTNNGPGTLPAAARACRIVSGHPEGFHEGFANIYSDAAEAVSARIAGTKADPLALDFPNSADGARGVAFAHAAVTSSKDNSAWTDCRIEL